MLFQRHLCVVKLGMDARASYTLGKHSTKELISSLFFRVCLCVYMCAHMFVCASAGACIPQHSCRSQSTILAAGPQLLPCLRQGLFLSCTTRCSQTIWPLWELLQPIAFKILPALGMATYTVHTDVKAYAAGHW